MQILNTSAVTDILEAISLMISKSKQPCYTLVTTHENNYVIYTLLDRYYGRLELCYKVDSSDTWASLSVYDIAGKFWVEIEEFDTNLVGAVQDF